MVFGESVCKEQILEGIERRRQIRGAAGFVGVIVPLAVFFIFILL